MTVHIYRYLCVIAVMVATTSWETSETGTGAFTTYAQEHASELALAELVRKHHPPDRLYDDMGRARELGRRLAILADFAKGHQDVRVALTAKFFVGYSLWYGGFTFRFASHSRGVFEDIVSHYPGTYEAALARDCLANLTLWEAPDSELQKRLGEAIQTGWEVLPVLQQLDADTGGAARALRIGLIDDPNDRFAVYHLFDITLLCTCAGKPDEARRAYTIIMRDYADHHLVGMAKQERDSLDSGPTICQDGQFPFPRLSGEPARRE